MNLFQTLKTMRAPIYSFLALVLIFSPKLLLACKSCTDTTFTCLQTSSQQIPIYQTVRYDCTQGCAESECLVQGCSGSYVDPYSGNVLCSSYYCEQTICMQPTESCLGSAQQIVGYQTQSYCSLYGNQCTNYAYGDKLTFIGTARSTATSLPISASTITVTSNTGTKTVTTDANGYYSVTMSISDDSNYNLTATVCASANGVYAQQCSNVSVRDGDSACGKAPQIVNFNRTPKYGATNLVQALYTIILGRSAAAVEAAGWADRLQNMSVQQAAYQFFTSQEYRGDLIVSYYQSVLGRYPSSSEIAGWVAQLNSGQTDEQVLIGFLASTEFYNRVGGTSAAFIKGLYQTLLNRQPSSADLNWWLSVFNPSNRAATASAFVTCPERRTDQVNAWYLAYLHRAADSGGLNYFVNELLSGMQDEQAESQFFGSSEFISKYP